MHRPDATTEQPFPETPAPRDDDGMRGWLPTDRWVLGRAGFGRVRTWLAELGEGEEPRSTRAGGSGAARRRAPRPRRARSSRARRTH